MSAAPTSPEDRLLAGLNDVQRDAVLHPDGPLLILAGAGSGKTRVLTHRVARLVADGVPAGRIMAVTFTNKAAGEMRERIRRLVGGEARLAWVGTFHALCARLLREHADRVGLNSRFVVYDASDQQQVVKQAMKSLDIDEQALRPRVVLSLISRAKEQLLSPADYQREAYDFTARKVAAIYPEYDRILRANNAADFDDLIGLVVTLMRRDAEVRGQWQARFDHVLVDEYQDINQAQYELVNLLVTRHHNLCVVGDDDQSIYSWRGADIRFILDFQETYPEAQVHKLEQNYRSTQRILDAAHGVVQQNAGRHEKKLWTSNPTGERIQLITASDETDEARAIARLIDRLIAADETRESGFGSFAVLYRTNAQSRALEDGLRRDRMPFRVIGGQRFYERKEIKDLLAYLRLVLNPLDSVSFQRVLNEPPRSLGTKTEERLFAHAEARGIPLLEAAANSQEVEGLQPRQQTALRQFAAVIERAISRRDVASVTELTQIVLQETGYQKELEQQETIEAKSRIENLQEFLTVTQQFDERGGGRLVVFMEEQALASDVDQLAESEEAVTLMTLHSAKGLEFPYVIIAGAEEELFPHSSAITDERQMEEERRLCYVGITRAQKHLAITHTRRRMVMGQTRRPRLSRFVLDIPRELFDHDNPPERAVNPYGDLDDGRDAPPRTGWGAPQPRRRLAELDSQALLERHRAEREDEGAGDYQVGDQVRHPKFGSGIVTKSIGCGEQERVTVIFRGGIGKKTLAPSHTTLEKIS